MNKSGRKFHAQIPKITFKDPAIIKEFNLIHSPSSIIKFNLVFYRYTYPLINI